MVEIENCVNRCGGGIGGRPAMLAPCLKFCDAHADASIGRLA
jgi:hypothetical protein